MDIYKGVIFQYPLNLEHYTQTCNDMAAAGYALERITPLTDMPHTNGLLVTFRLAAAPTLAATIDRHIEQEVRQRRLEKLESIARRA